MSSSSPDLADIAGQYRLLHAMIASGTPPPRLEGDGWVAQSDTRGALSEIRVVRQGSSRRPALRAFYVAECSARPELLPLEIPFVSDLPCLVTLSETGGHASWPASQARQPDVSSFLEALLPPFYVHANHPRRLLLVLEKLRARLLQAFPGDPRGVELGEVATRMKDVVRGEGGAVSDDEWASPADMATLWQVYDTLGMPWHTVVRLEKGFDELDRWLADGGWTDQKSPGPLWMGPVPGRSRVAFFRRGTAAAQLLRGASATGYRSLSMDWQTDAYV